MSVAWSLITVTFNSAATLRRFWSAKRPSDVEWIVVDNGSADDTVRTAEALGAHVIALERNRGFSAANNIGLSAASGRYVAFINPDVKIQSADLGDLASTIDRYGGLVGPQLLNNDGTLQPNGRGAPLLLHKVLHRLRPHSAANGYLLTAGSGVRRYAFWLMGAAVAGTATEIRKLAGWNERFFLYYEDKDLSIRAWQAGLPVVLDGSVQWTHGWARETKSFRLKPWLHEFRSLATFYSMYPEFLLGGRPAVRSHDLALKLSGTKIEDEMRLD